jgi:hypothetical protein
MSGAKIFLTPVPGNALTFDVTVRDGRGESRHLVTIKPDEAKLWSEFGAEPSDCVGAAMRFLIDREPKESILAAFDMSIVRRYFLEFDDVFPSYLALLRDESPDRA